MRTRLFLTIDTELSPALFQRENRNGLERNFASSFAGRCSAGDFGVGYQMEVLDSFGLKAVFFVDPMPGLVWGIDVVRRMVAPILDRGHDIQLHIHTEWLEYCTRSPVAGNGTNINAFPFDEQVVLLSLARDLLLEAGALPPKAFRAGNYGANDATLNALAKIGVAYDSSFNPGMPSSPCQISLPRNVVDPIQHAGVTEVPISAIEEAPGRLRPAQVCAMSAWEMRSAIDHAIRSGHETFTVVCHSFELLSRDRERPNQKTVRRFHALCEHLAARRSDIDISTYSEASFAPAGQPIRRRLRANPVRTLHRMAEQALSNWQYDLA